MTFQEQLSAAREAARLTQEDVALARGDVTLTTYRNWEAGRYEPSQKDQQRLATLLQVTFTVTAE